MYVYFETGFYPNLVHFYTHKEMNEKGKASPVLLNYPSSKIPVEELYAMDGSRYSTQTQAREWLAKVDHKLMIATVFS